MKHVTLLLIFVISGLLANAQVPLEYGARFTGKYTFSVGLKYETGDWGLNLNANLRSFNGPFASQVSGPRPIDYNLDIGVGFSTFSGSLDLDASLGLHQVYGSAGLTQTAASNWLGTGVGLYGQWYLDAEEDGTENQISLRTSISPGVYSTRFSIAPSFTTNIVGLYSGKVGDEDITSTVDFFTKSAVGIRGDVQPITIQGSGNIGLSLNGYYPFPEDEPEVEEVTFPLNARLGLNYQF